MSRCGGGDGWQFPWLAKKLEWSTAVANYRQLNIMSVVRVAVGVGRWLAGLMWISSRPGEMRTKSNPVISSKRQWYIEQEAGALSVAEHCRGWPSPSLFNWHALHIICIFCYSSNFNAYYLSKFCMPSSMIQLNWLYLVISAFNGAFDNCIVCV